MVLVVFGELFLVKPLDSPGVVPMTVCLQKCKKFTAFDSNGSCAAAFYMSVTVYSCQWKHRWVAHCISQGVCYLIWNFKKLLLMWRLQSSSGVQAQIEVGIGPGHFTTVGLSSRISPVAIYVCGAKLLVSLVNCDCCLRQNSTVYCSQFLPN